MYHVVFKLRESYSSYQCQGDDIIIDVTMAIKDVLAHCKNRLLSIQKQITCPDGHYNEQFWKLLVYIWHLKIKEALYRSISQGTGKESVAMTV